MSNTTIPARKDIPESDKWDLSSIYKSNEEWEENLKVLPSLTEKVVQYKGRLGESSDVLLEALKALEEAELRMETVYHYASLQHEADEDDSSATDRDGRAMMAYTRMMSDLSFIDPEIQSVDETKLRKWISLPEFKDYKIYIEKLLHFKKYILSEKEERILSLQMQPAQTPYNAFSVLSNVDMNKTFGTVNVCGEERPLTETTWSVFMENQDRKVREEAYKKFYQKFEEHQNTIAALYAGNVNQDVFLMRARGYSSSLEMALFGNKVPVSVYHNLIDCVHKNLAPLHEYYALRKKVLGVDELRHYDVYVPLVKSVETKTSYDEAVEICRKALSPLGTEYTDRLCDGLKNGWVDRYENVGKRSGAFSSGSYIGNPYILLNYKDDVIRDVFTMAHEGGHSMHSWYSVHNNPFMCYDYTIFEAEVASTFNEELVFEYLLKNAETKEMRAYLLSMRAGDILATLYRQTMFAEFELKAHELVEGGTPLTAELLRKTYRELLELYFGKEMHFEPNSDMEGLRIPHFYSSFYVYKYATGISAALALAKRVTEGGTKEREDYFAFLKSGGSRYPIESLRIAGVDMEKTKPVQDACDEFAKVIAELKEIL
ncbi:MAG: oligoendopeptidase F [Treponema porcinum]|uniref:oligoendopeptidase F n=1 Tax=Treponema porcinum TaxID=261392 RepID=UPI002354AD18|nr:oligoendopeptidase F [Treponema porcinum]MCI6983888.1 oligoendopeptidase F [Treponema porcinum]MCI7545718.1 oligoendopeptidase F [Treponema porcinum]MDD6898388.1 oligoendopeptidase F [Treponema porcinum]MDY4189489.1 oligoendopeptidase F [Treponema porcinum]